jgi:phosphohistidine phosphatase SixA
MPATAQDEPTVVYLVRHAERAEDGTRDPVISLPGWDRSRLLAVMLRDAGLTRIHTTDYRRTRATGRPTAEVTGLTMDLYDPRDLEGFARQLQQTPGRHLVLGHSDTTPGLVAALGGDPGTPIGALEYDRLYIVTLGDDGTSTVLIRFGKRFQG